VHRDIVGRAEKEARRQRGKEANEAKEAKEAKEAGEAEEGNVVDKRRNRNETRRENLCGINEPLSST
jgi:hypothetical protein